MTDGKANNAAKIKTPALPSHEIIELIQEWPSLARTQRRSKFSQLKRSDAEELFLNLMPRDQKKIIDHFEPADKRSWLRLLEPNDAADLIQKYRTELRESLLSLLDVDTQNDVIALLAYAEDAAGGLMNSRFIRLRPEITVDVAIRYLRSQARSPVETINFAYVLDATQKLLGVISFKDLLLAHPDQLASSLMATKIITLPENMDQEEVSRRFAQYGFSALPVVDAEGRMKGIVTSANIVQVVQKETTKDIQKMGGSEAFDEPYMQIGFFEMIKKRAGWLVILFLGEMLTATAMGYYQKEIERAVVLALFIPLIISSGGNSGSQATSLIIRALALQEVKLKDWFKIFIRELGSGLTLGLILGSIGLLRILLWPTRNATYGEHYLLIAATVSFSLIGVVTWGSLAGSMLPFALRRLGFDPATASAPFVATLVDVTGLIIYFTVASTILGGTLL